MGIGRLDSGQRKGETEGKLFVNTAGTRDSATQLRFCRSFTGPPWVKAKADVRP